MHATCFPLKGWRWFLIAAALTAAAVAEEGAAGIPGVYEDDGTTVTSGAASTEGIPSFLALLKLEFDPAVAKVLHDETAQIAVRQEENLVEIEARDADGTVSWTGRWIEGDGWVRQGAAIVLRFRATRVGAEEFRILLEPLSENGLLQVQVQRVTPTVLGPAVRSMGTYLFHRAS